jgi:phosphoserine phosphatase RsbU/P
LKTGHLPQSRIPPDSQSRMSTLSILVVNDTPVSAGVVECMLASKGFRTFIAADRQPARAIGRSEQPNPILLDGVMPGEPGFVTCARLKPEPATADLPIIFQSGDIEILRETGEVRR